MAYDLSWSPSAQTDLRQISAYIAQDDPEVRAGSSKGYFMSLSASKLFLCRDELSPNSTPPKLEKSFVDLAGSFIELATREKL